MKQTILICLIWVLLCSCAYKDATCEDYLKAITGEEIECIHDGDRK